MSNIKLLLRLFYQPSAAMSAILDEGSLLFASLAVLGVSLLAPHWLPFSFYTPLLLLAVVYVPGTLLVTMLLASLGAFWTVFERDYSPLLTCTSLAWAAVNLPLVLAARAAPPATLVPLAVLAYLYFAVLMFFAIRTVFGIENGMAAGAVCLSVIPLAGALAVWGPIRAMAGWLASPFFLFYAYRYLGGEFSNLGAGLRSRQNFHRMLEAAAINPHDAEARYQLGLIYQQRHQYTEAIRQYKSAVAIDPKETDAHFQLGRIALEQGRLKDAFESLQRARPHVPVGQTVRRCAARAVDVHRAEAVRSGRALLLRPDTGPAGGCGGRPRDVCARCRSRARHATLSPALHGQVEPSGPKAIALVLPALRIQPVELLLQRSSSLRNCRAAVSHSVVRRSSSGRK